MKTVLIIRASGAIEKAEQAKAPELEQLQKAVGGYIETVPHFTRLEHDGVEYKRGTAYCNEDGIAKGLPPNNAATVAWLKCLGSGPFTHQPRLIGDVIFYATTPK